MGESGGKDDKNISKFMNLTTLFKERILNNQFFTGSLIMVVGSNVYNGGQFIYHILAGNILSKAHYGDLAALINILGIFALVQISIGLTIVKFIASEKSPSKIRGLTQWGIKWSAVFGGIVALLILIFSPTIVGFLHLTEPKAVYFLAPLIFLYAITSIARSVLQGLLKFSWFIASLLTEVGFKMILMIPFVFLGYAVVGAMGALLFGVFVSCAAGMLPLKGYLFKNGDKPQASTLFKYSFPAFLQGIALTSMYSTDLFLVKHFFSPEVAGLYAVLAKLGTIVFFGASPISHVMFPLVAKKYSHGEPYHKIFYLSLFLVAALSVLITILYILIPKVFLSAFGSQYVEGSNILWWFGVFMGLLAAAMLCIQFYLSIGRTFVVSIFIAFALMQAVLIWFFHASLLQVIQMSIISAALLVLSLLIYFPYHDRK